MDPLTASLIAVACLAAGALAGWFAHMARAATTSARAHAALQARVAVAENEAVGLREQLDVRVDEYRDLIERMRARRLTMICANPDVVVERGEQLVYCAGALAEVTASDLFAKEQNR